MTDRPEREEPPILYVDAHYRHTIGSTEPWSETGVFGPFRDRKRAESCLVQLAGHPSIISAIIRDPEEAAP